MTTANLTIIDNETVVQYTSSGESAFVYPFPILAANELRVSVDQVDQLLTVHYTISGIGDAGGGTVTFVSATTSGELITIWQDMPFKRLTGFNTGAAVLTGQALNTEFARQVRHDQQLRREIGLALRLQVDDPLSGQDMVVPTQVTRAGKFLAFDASGKPTVSDGSGGGDTSLRGDLASTAASLGNQLVAITKTNAEDSAGVTIVGPAKDLGDPERYKANTTPGTTDMSAGFVDAFSVDSRDLQIIDRHVVGDVTASAGIDGHGRGEVLALLGSATAFNLVNDDVFGLWSNHHFQNLRLDMIGAAAPRTIHGFMYPDTPSSPAKTLAGRNMWTNVVIKHADIAIYQPTGNFGTVLNYCSLENCNYGVFGVESNTPQIMHPGFLQAYGGQISGARKAAVYLKCPTESVNGSIIQNTSIQDNWGHGVYLDGWNLAVEPFTLNCVHFENNDANGDGTIDLGFGRGAETIRDLMCHDVDLIRIIGTPVTGDVGMEFNNSMALMDNCWFGMASLLQQDASSVVVCTNANLNGITHLADVEIVSLVQQRMPSGANGATMIARIPHRTRIVRELPGSGVGVYGQSFAHADVDLTGSGGTGTRTKGSPGLYKHYNKYTALLASTSYVSAELIALVQNKWYAYSMLIRKSAFDLANVKYMNGTVHLVQAGENILDNNVLDDEWVTIGGVCEFDGTSGNARQLITTDAGSVPDISLGESQVVQFDNQREATAYFNRGDFWDSKDYDYSGVATLSGGTLAIDFSTEGFDDQPDTAYGIQLTSDSATNARPSAQATTGFTITGGTTDDVEWKVYRRDL